MSIGQLQGRPACCRDTYQESPRSFTFIEAAVLEGRLANALGSSDTLLSVILGPPDEWREAQISRSSGSFAVSGDLGRAGRGKPPAPDSRFAIIQQQFRCTGVLICKPPCSNSLCAATKRHAINDYGL